MQLFMSHKLNINQTCFSEDNQYTVLQCILKFEAAIDR